MKVELKVNFTSSGMIQIVAYPERNELYDIQTLQMKCFSQISLLRDELSSFMEKVDFAESDYESQEDESYKLFTNGFVHHFLLGESFVILSYRWRQIHLYHHNKGMSLTYGALESLVKQLERASEHE